MIAAADTLLFDLDGTLTDSRPGIVACPTRLRHSPLADADRLVATPAGLAHVLAASSA